ncbi:uncharacterized protein LOC143363997 [Halictus rubicundus]|uniref:uncharacterized protein LOC143363651 n=1 Tax=Halictus rubicundus TaxID=77578 RepID=UPI0040367B3C
MRSNSSVIEHVLLFLDLIVNYIQRPYFTMLFFITVAARDILPTGNCRPALLRYCLFLFFRVYVYAIFYVWSTRGGIPSSIVARNDVAFFAHAARTTIDRMECLIFRNRVCHLTYHQSRSVLVSKRINRLGRRTEVLTAEHFSKFEEYEDLYQNIGQFKIDEIKVMK